MKYFEINKYISMKTRNTIVTILLFFTSLVFPSDYSGKTANIILICGQSNAAGRALKSSIVRNEFTSLDTVKYSQGGDSNLSLTLRQTFTLNGLLNSTYNYHGLEFGLGEGLHKSGMSNVLIVKYAWGGSWIDLWRKDNTSIYEGKSNLYNNTISFLQDKVKEMEQLGYSQFSFKGLVWLQGESDAILTGRANVYGSKLNTLLTNFRTDIAGIFNITPKSVPVVLVQPASYADKTKYENPEDELKVNNALSIYAMNNNRSEYIATNDLTGYVDAIHFNTSSQNEIGNRIAEKMKFIPKTVINVKDYGAIGDGITDDGPAIDAAFADAANLKGNVIVSFEQKIYRIGEKAPFWHYFNIVNLDGLVIEGNGAELQFTRTNQPFRFENCTNLIVRNLNVDYIEPTYTQGRIVAMDKTKASVDVLVQDGYPLPPGRLVAGGGGAHGIIFDPVQYSRKLFPDIDDDHFKVDSVTKVSDRIFRFFFTSKNHRQLNYIQLNDRLTHGFAWTYLDPEYRAQKTGIPTGAVQLRECSDVLFEDFNLYAALSQGFTVDNCDSDIIFRRTNIKRKPGTDRLLTLFSDGIHSDNNRGAIIIDNCLLESTGDDVTSLHSKEDKIITKLNATTFELVTTDNAYAFNLIKVNDELMFLNRSAGTVLGTAIVQSVTVNTATKRHTVVLDRVVNNLDVGITSINLTSGSPGTTIKNSILNPITRNAMLLRILNGTIENNVINCYGGKIGINLTDETNTAPFSRNIKVINNKIYDADLIGINIGCAMAGVREDTTATGNFLVRDNLINSRRLNGIKIRNTNRVFLINNTINMIGGAISNGNAIEATNIRDVVIDSLTINDNRTGMLNNTAMRFSNCVEGSFVMTNLFFNLTAGMSNYVFLNNLTTYFVRPLGDGLSWTKMTGISPQQIITSNSPGITSTNTYYFAKGNYTMSGITLTSGNIYGGFKGDETEIDLSARELIDKDENGIVEHWEFANETIINGTAPFTGSGSATNRLITVTGGEINGLTLQDHFYNSDTGAGTIILGAVSTTPTLAMDIYSNAGRMINCTVRKIKAFRGPVMLTNKSSLVEGSLIEECMSTSSTTGTAAIFMNLLGGKVANSVVRNNFNPGGSGGGIFANSLASTDMNAIIENCVLYNNTARFGAAIRGEARTDKRGIQIINCTAVNNNSTTATVASVDLISGGLIVNSIVLDDKQNEIRANTTNHYLSNNVFGSLALGSSVTAFPNTDMTSGKTVADFDFIRPTNFQGAVITGSDDFDQAKYDLIGKANFNISSNSKSLSFYIGLKSLAANYRVGGTGEIIPLTATIPSYDILGYERPVNELGNLSLGAYQHAELTDITTSATTDIKIFPTIQGVVIKGAEGSVVKLYDLTGRQITSAILGSSEMAISLKKGIYIISIDHFRTKLLIK